MKATTNLSAVVLNLALFASGVSFAQSGSANVNFTLSLNQSVDSGLTYNNFNVGDTATGSEHAIGFQIQINSVNSEPLSFGPVAAFCSEIQEPISTSSYTFTASHLSNLAAGQAGLAGTASAGIPSGGIGDLRAARLSYLFDQHYISADLTEWTMTDATPTLHAFQLAVWELTHDVDLDLSLNSGDLYVGNQTGSNLTRRNNALSLSQSYLDEVNAANIDASYVSSEFTFWALTSATGNGADGNPGFQDIILAANKNSVLEQTLNPLILIPELGTLSMFGISFSALGLFCGFGRKRKRYNP